MPKAKAVVQEGKIVLANEKFYVAIGRTRQAIPTGTLVDAASLKKLVGQTVSVTICAGLKNTRSNVAAGIITAG